MQQTTAFWDKVAERYSRQPIKDMDAYTYTLDRTRSYLAEGDKVLELGCGTGSTALLLAPSVAEYTASDISSEMSRIGRGKAEDAGITNITFVTAEVDGKALGEGPYDAILAFNLLHLVEDLPAALRAVHKRLKPGGTFISKTPSMPSGNKPLVYRLLPLFLPIMRLFGKAPGYVNLRQIKELEDLIAKAGFKIIETGNYPASPANRFVVARKV